MHYIQRVLCCSIISLGLAGCGGGGGGSSTPASKSSAPLSSAAASIVASSSLVPSSVAASAVASSSTASSIANVVINFDMANGWRGNGTGNSGVNPNSDGVTFAALASDIGAVTDLVKPIMLEGAVIEMVVNVSSEFKASGADLQIFAQLKENWALGEWNCRSANGLLIAGTDVTLSCTIDEPDGKFNQSTYDVQLGIQAKGTAETQNIPAGTVTIKSAKVTLKNQTGSSSSAYSANVERLAALANFPVGAAVSNTDSATYNILTNAREKAVVEKHFNQMTAGNIMKMSYLQPTQGNFTFTDADAFVDYAKSKNITIHGHALLWHSSYQVPAFMRDWSGSKEDFLTAIETHVTTIVDHYEAKGGVVSWDVVNEALNDNSPSNFRTDSALYTKSGNSAVYIEKAFQAARAADPSVTLYYNDYNIDQNNAKTTKLIEMLTDFQARGIPIDGVGFQMHVFMDYPTIGDIRQSMQKVAAKGLKVKITEMDVAVNNPYNPSWPGNKRSTFSNTVAVEQQQRYCQIVEAYLAVVPEAQRGGITVWGTTDASTWLTTAISQYNGEAIAWPLLFDNNYNDKPALRGFADALQGKPCTTL